MRPLTNNEKFLILLLLGLIFIGANVAGYRWLQSAQAALDLKYATLRSDHAEAEVDLQGQSAWAERKAWLNQHEPSLGDEGTSKAQVLEFVLKGARDHQLEILEQNLDETEHGVAGPCIAVDVKVKGSMQSLCQWMADLQKPENFYAVPRFSLKADQDQKSMICTVQVTRYFKPGS